MSLTLILTAGDPGGIGPEVALKALAAEFPTDDSRYVLVGAAEVWRRTAAELDLTAWLTRAAAPGTGRITYVDTAPGCSLDDPGDCARATLAWLEKGAQLCRAGAAHALITGPVSKARIINAGHPEFVGQTEHLAALVGNPPTTMMLLGTDEQGRWLRVALATQHVPLARVSATLRIEGIRRALGHAADACRELGLARSRVGVCGLNPHAGEDGKLGDEEGRLIGPAVAAARADGLDAHGPFAADTLFHHVLRGDYDAVLAMYHDQGLVPLKMVAFATGVNWTLGLPFIRTSPDHGTAFDIAGRGVADPSSMRAALRLARQLAVRSATVGLRWHTLPACS